MFSGGYHTKGKKPEWEAGADMEMWTLYSWGKDESVPGKKEEAWPHSGPLDLSDLLASFTTYYCLLLLTTPCLLFLMAPRQSCKHLLWVYLFRQVGTGGKRCSGQAHATLFLIPLPHGPTPILVSFRSVSLSHELYLFFWRAARDLCLMEKSS